MRTIVYGNGKSRQKWNVSEKLDDVVTWGCNRIFNDVKVDNVVAVDYRSHVCLCFGVYLLGEYPLGQVG